MKLWTIRAFDWIDAHVIGHRCMWVCRRIAASEWWGSADE